MRRRMQPPSPFDLLPDELLLHIMAQCVPRALSSSEAVCRRWRSLLSSGGAAAWLLNTEHLWAGTGWAHNVSRSCALTERLDKVPVCAMRLALRGYDTAGLVEKSEWLRLLRVKLLWGPLVCARSPRGWVAPPWALNLMDCKAAFYFAMIEIARDAPLECELPRQRWDLTFNAQPSELFEIEFFPNHEMTSTSHPGARMRWSMQHRGPTYASGLLIENFPLHAIRRRHDGLWVMANAHVTITQRPPPPGDLPLFDVLP